MSKDQPPGFVRLKTRDQKILYEYSGHSIKQALEAAVADNVTLKNLDLSYQDLSCINLDDAKITDVSFVGCNLLGANLSEAYISSCDFMDANLIGACMAYSRIQNCVLKNVNLAACDFSGACILNTSFSGLGAMPARFNTAHCVEGCYFYDDEYARKILIQPNMTYLATPKGDMVVVGNSLLYKGKIVCLPFKHFSLSQQQSTIR